MWHSRLGGTLPCVAHNGHTAALCVCVCAAQPLTRSHTSCLHALLVLWQALLSPQHSTAQRALQLCCCTGLSACAPHACILLMVVLFDHSVLVQPCVAALLGVGPCPPAPVAPFCGIHACIHALRVYVACTQHAVGCRGCVCIRTACIAGVYAGSRLLLHVCCVLVVVGGHC